VLLLARHLDLGGTERQLCEMAKSLDPLRFAVHVGSFRPGGIRAAEIEAWGRPVVQVPLDSFRSPSSVARAIRMLRRYVRTHDIHIVHAFDPPAVLLAGLAAPFLRPARVLSSQRCFRDVFSTRRQHLLRLSERLTHGLIVNCRALERQRQDESGLGTPALHLCYNGIDALRFRRMTEVERPDTIPPDAIVVGSVCGLRPEKGLPTLLLAFAAARATNGRLFLLLVGDGSERGRLESQARELGITGHCLFQPTAADVVPWLSLIDIFVLASATNEALSNALMEAMACGCACIASSVGGNPELVEHGRTGLLFEPNDVGGLARQIARLAADRSLAAALARRASDRIAREFSLEAAAARLGAIYDEVLGHDIRIDSATSVESLRHKGQATA
jgi:glycosyltransferase involved in cell wall biosynthesis